MYGLILRLLCPASFRNEYGGEMRALFEKRLGETAWIAKAWVWIDAIADVCIAAAGAHWDLLRQDLRYALRAASRAPGLTSVIIVVAAVGVAAATSVFSIADHILLRPLPFPQAERLVHIWQDQTALGYPKNNVSPGNYRDWKSLSGSFASMASFGDVSLNMSGEGEPRHVIGSTVNHELFTLLGVAPMLGRAFTAGDDRDGAPLTVVLSHSFWQGQFGGDRGVLGRRIQLDGAPATVIGVMPADFFYPNRNVRIWITLRLNEGVFEDRGNLFLRVAGRLKPGVTFEQAAAELRVIGSNLERQHPAGNKNTNIVMTRMRDELPVRSRTILTILAGAAGFLLLIACSNLANLLLAKAAARGKELGVRAALGAGRERLVRQLLTESALLALIGGAAGTALAAAAVPLLTRLVPSSLPVAATPEMDWRVLVFAFGVTAITGIAFGVLPALRATRTALGLRSASGQRRERTRRILVVVQVAASLALVVSTGLLVRALTHVQNVAPGFSLDGRMAFRTNLPFPKYLDTAVRERFYTTVLEGIRGLPGVQAAAITSFRPMGDFRGGIWPVLVAGQTGPHHGCARFVTPGYFEAMGMPLLSGRDIQASDRTGTQQVAVVSESFAKEHFAGESGVGRTFGVPFGNLTFTVVGVVGDIRFRGIERQYEPQFYMASAQMRDGAFVWFVPKDFVVSTSLDDPLTLIPAVRRIISQADPDQPVSDIQTLTGIVEAETATRRVQLWVIGAFALAAFLLAGVGIHGLLSFAVSQRTQEIGLRRALGAGTPQIAALVFNEAALLGTAGAVLGVAAAYAANRGLEAFLAGVSSTDGAALGLAAVAAVLMTLAGASVPALRAMRVDPVTALRSE